MISFTKVYSERDRRGDAPATFASDAGPQPRIMLQIWRLAGGRGRSGQLRRAAQAGRVSATIAATRPSQPARTEAWSRPKAHAPASSTAARPSDVADRGAQPAVRHRRELGDGTRAGAHDQLVRAPPLTPAAGQRPSSAEPPTPSSRDDRQRRRRPGGERAASQGRERAGATPPQRTPRCRSNARKALVTNRA